MDTFRSNQDRERDLDLDGAYAYQAGELPTAQPKTSSTGFGFGLLKALRLNSQGQAEATTETETYETENGAEFAGFVNNRTSSSSTFPMRPHVEPLPVYKGEYSNLCPLYFNTEPVDNANDTKLDRVKLTKYSRAQLFFLLRLERFLRLRHFWLKASPRNDEQWKTSLVMRSIFSAMEDCITHGVGDDAKVLVKDWGCC